MSALTLDIAEFLASLDPAALPSRCIEAACMGMTDCVGVMIAGAQKPAVRLVAAMAVPTAASDGAPEIPSGRHLAVADAALVNGVAGHVLDFDDVGIDGHPSAVLTPAILAEGWALNVSGKEALAAYVAGYEIWALIEELEPGHLHERGFHPTAVSGALASAAACAKLHRLDAESSAHAIAIAASLAAGLVANFGTMTKSLHAGRAAQSGVIAARLARSGFTASTDVLEHKTGFMHAHSPSGIPDLEREDWGLGSNWRLEQEGIHVKRYPICYATHRAIDAMLSLTETHNLTADQVEEIRVHTGRTQSLMLRNHAPKTGLEAKFSMEFAMASSLISRQVGLTELTDDYVRRPEVITTMEKVTCTTTDEALPGLPFAPEDNVSVRLKNGKTIAHEPVIHAKGSWQTPLSEDERKAKFMDCCTGRIPERQAARLFHDLNGVGELKSLQGLPLTVTA